MGTLFAILIFVRKPYFICKIFNKDKLIQLTRLKAPMLMSQKKDYPDNAKKKFILFTAGVYLSLLLFTIFFAIFNYHKGLYYSFYAASFGIFGYLLSMYFYIRKKKYLTAVYIVYLTLGPAVVLASYAEGLMSGNYWFVLTMLYAIPLMIRRKHYFLKHSKILYAITIVLILLISIISPMYTEMYPHLTKGETHTKLLINSTVCFIVIIIFSIIGLRSGKLFIRQLFKEKQRAEKEKDNRTRVLANIGHELRTQINSINGITQLILEQDKLEKKEKEYAEILDYCNNKMLVLVNDILDIHKIESGKFELNNIPRDLNKVLAKITIPFLNIAEKKNLTLKTVIDKKLSYITVNLDETRLTQVLHNLLSNAFKFTEYGSISFTAEVLEENNDVINVKFTITDTGIGIPEELQMTIFESFQQIKNDSSSFPGGTGLGLAISKTIVEKMGANIQVKSELNKGSSFSFSVTFEKIVNNVSKNQEKISANATQFLSNTSILIVEDNVVSMMYVNKLLKNHGANTFQAINGAKAIEILKNKHQEIEIVLLDLEMPVMNGFKAITFIKKDYPDVTVIAFTANIPSEDMMQNLKELGFDDMISKPFKKEEILTVLQKKITS